VRVVLRADVQAVGKRGDIVEVADGYARNLLLPTGQAMIATPGVVSQAGAMRRSRDMRDAKDREGSEAIARRLVPIVIRIEARSGSEGRLFGSVTTSDIVEAVKSQANVELDTRKLLSDEPIRTLGTHEVGVRLHPEVEFRLTIEVVAA
jgi:large subunit ribosomal protein L9